MPFYFEGPTSLLVYIFTSKEYCLQQTLLFLSLLFSNAHESFICSLSMQPDEFPSQGIEGYVIVRVTKIQLVGNCEIVQWANELCGQTWAQYSETIWKSRCGNTYL